MAPKREGRQQRPQLPVAVRLSMLTTGTAAGALALLKAESLRAGLLESSLLRLKNLAQVNHWVFYSAGAGASARLQEPQDAADNEETQTAHVQLIALAHLLDGRCASALMPGDLQAGRRFPLAFMAYPAGAGSGSASLGRRPLAPLPCAPACHGAHDCCARAATGRSACR